MKSRGLSRGSQNHQLRSRPSCISCISGHFVHSEHSLHFTRGEIFILRELIRVNRAIDRSKRNPRAICVRNETEFGIVGLMILITKVLSHRTNKLGTLALRYMFFTYGLKTAAIAAASYAIIAMNFTKFLEDQRRSLRFAISRFRN